MARILETYGSMLHSDFDQYIRPELKATVGGRLRKYTNWRKINGESRKVTIGGQGNYTDQAPDLYTKAKQDAFNKKMSGKTREVSLSPKYKYAYEIMYPEERNSLKKDPQGRWRLEGNEYFLRKMREALEIAEDVVIMKAMEEQDANIPAGNKFGDSSLPIYAAKNIEMLKAGLIAADSRYNGTGNAMNVGAFMVIDTTDWAKVLGVNTNGGVFMSSDYQHMTGIDGRRVTSVFGVAIERVNPFEHTMGDDERAGYIKTAGTARLCVYENIYGCSWEDDVRTSVEENMFDNDSIKFGVAKSMDAKVIDPAGLFIFSFKSEGLNEYTPTELGSSEANPVHTKSGA